jgi:hypothetical protein
MTTKANTVALLIRLLRPIVRILIRTNLSFRDFNEVAKLVFVDEASKNYGVRGRPTNISRIALLVGLTRREVSRLRRVSDSGHLQLDYPTIIEQLLEVWPQNNRSPVRENLENRTHFCDLPLEGQNSLTILVQQVKNDVPTTTIIKELAHTGIIEIRGNSVSLVGKENQTLCAHQFALSRLARTIEAVDDAAKQISSINKANQINRECGSTLLSTDARSPDEFDQFVKLKTLQFTKEIETWISQPRAPESAPTPLSLHQNH